MNEIGQVKTQLGIILKHAHGHSEEYVAVIPHAVILGKLLTGESALDSREQLSEAGRQVFLPFEALRRFRNVVPERLRQLSLTRSAAEQLWDWAVGLNLGQPPRSAEELRSLISEDTTALPELKLFENPSSGAISGSSLTTRVFIVHGSDHGPRDAADALLQRVKLDPVILEDQPSGGKTVIEKMEVYTDVSYGVVLLTADDLGNSKEEWERSGHSPDCLLDRARQNAVLELGFLMGKLGRDKVAALYVDGVDLPSDFKGVVYILLDKPGAWKKKLVSELKAAGLPGEFDKIL